MNREEAEQAWKDLQHTGIAVTSDGTLLEMVDDDLILGISDDGVVHPMRKVKAS